MHNGLAPACQALVALYDALPEQCLQNTSLQVVMQNSMAKLRNLLS